jgi:hypothetical protein
MVTMPILVFPDWSKKFHVLVDASSIALGALLAQPGAKYIDHPLAFSSRKLSTTKINYTTTEREGLAMEYALQKFHHYLLGGVGSQPNFFDYSQKAAYTPCGIMTNHCHFLLINIRFIFCDNFNSISFVVFHNYKCENTSFR